MARSRRVTRPEDTAPARLRATRDTDGVRRSRHGLAPAIALLALQTLPEGLSDVAEQLSGVVPSGTTPTGAAVFGGGGLVGLAVVWRLFGRVRGGGSASSRAAATSTKPGGHGKHNVAFTLPGLLPVSKGIRSVTHNEIHAAQLGLLVGFVVVWLTNAGRTELAFGIVGAFVVGALGYGRYATKAFETIRIEPWYALLAFAGGAGVAHLVLGGGVPV